MKKVVIISYFFPPCNLTASQRAYGWAKCLKQYGYEPIVITRNWDHPILQPEDVLKASGTSVIHEKLEDYEVIRVPYSPSIRDRAYVKLQNSPFQFITKILTFWNLILENFSTRVIPYRTIYTTAKDLIKNEKIDAMIISANPFEQFHFGYQLNRKTGIKWIADYRDDWSTSELNDNTSQARRFIKKLQAKSERKWVGSASYIISISDHYTKKIAKFNKVKGSTILNGFYLPELPVAKPDSDSFTITYNGSLYPSQPIEPFLSALKDVIQSNKSGLKIRVQFPGLAFDKRQADRVQTKLEEVIDNIEITERLPREEVLNMQQRSDLVLMISHKGLKGIPSSKLYEYIGLEKPVLLYPNDNDILEETLNDTGLGIICNSKEEIEKKLNDLIDLKREGKDLGHYKQNIIDSYSRKVQTKQLAELLDKITTTE